MSNANPLQLLRSNTANKRPDPTALADGRPAVNTNAVSPGLFFKDSAGNLVKVGPVHVGTTAPNASPASGGATGNSLGEQWLDTSGGVYVLKIWDGSAWRSETGTFVDASGDTMTGALVMDNQQQVRFREVTANGTNYIALQAPASVASDKTITLPDVNGTVVTTGDTGTVTSTMIADATIVDADISASAEIAVSKLADGTARQLLQTDAAGTGVEWTSNVDVPGTLDVTGAATFDSTVAVTGALTKSGSNVVTVGDTGTVTSTMILDGTIVNADVNASAAIAGTKISPDFGSQNITTTGTNTAASFIPTSSTAPANGVYLPAANSVAISTNGAGRLFVDGSGRVGVGISNPSSTYLHVYTTAPGTASAPTICLEGGVNGYGAGIDFASRTSAGGTLVSMAKITADGEAAWNTTASTQDANLRFFTAADGSLFERLRITSAGLVGVGTSSPSNLLEVSSASNSYIRSTTTTNSVSAIFGAYTSTVDVGSTTNHSLNFYTAGVNRATLDTSGRLGVGTTGPIGIFSARAVTNGNLHIRDINTIVSGTGVALDVLNDDSTTVQDLALRGATTSFHRAGSESARIDSSGRVGIGVTSVSELLHIKGGSSTSLDPTILIANGAPATSETASVDFGFNSQAADPDVLGRISATITNRTSGAQASTLAFSVASSGSLSPRMTLTGTGLGIGTTSPTATLQVSPSSGSANFQVSRGSKGLQINQDSDTADPNINTIGTTALKFLRDGSESMRIDASGRLLVGTSTARSNYFGAASGEACQLEVEGNDYKTSGASFTSTNNTIAGWGPHIALGRSRGGSVGTNGLVSNGDGTGSIIFHGNDGSSFIQSARIDAFVDGTPGANDMPGRLTFSVTRDGQSSPTEALRINNQGVAQITAVDTNSASLVISANATSGSQYGVLVSSANDQNGTSTYFYRAVGGPTERFTVRTNGGIANYQANDVNLSDRNAKKDISPAADTWNCIKEWEIVNYRYKDQPDDADLNLGVIAQQVAESCPEVITVFEEAKDSQPEKLGVKEQQMYWMAIKALQEAQTRIETLEAKVAALEPKP